MDTAEILVIAGGAASIAFILWFFFGQKEDTPPLPPDKAKGSATAEYSCPMHPWIKSDDPAALCSICGMKLTRAGE